MSSSQPQPTSAHGAPTVPLRADGLSPRERRAALARRLAAERPPLLRALSQDALAFARNRPGDSARVQSKIGRWLYMLRLPFAATEYLGLALYRVRVFLKAAHIPLVPSIIGWTCAICWGIRIGDPVLLQGGIYLPHGQIVIDGIATIESDAVLCPWITIGLQEGSPRGPHVERGVFVGTGAKILGPIRVGAYARIGANSVVISDVPARATAVGAPARMIVREDASEPGTPT